MRNKNSLLLARLWIGLAVLAPGMFLGAAPAQAGTKVDICHIPPGNPENFHTITINENAFAAHLAHGDLGEPCNAVCAQLCDDDNACTIDDTGDCESVGCPTLPDAVDCDDQNECTTDSCEPANGCVNTPRTGELCDDGQLCSGPDICDAVGQCQGPAIDNCCLGDEDCSGNPCDGAECNLGTNRCEEEPVICTAFDLCSVNECAPDTGMCVEGSIVCDDPNATCNIASGVCECLDSDFDGTDDCNDGCPSNPLLTQPDPTTGCDEVCMPSESQCSGPSLLVCNATGTGFDQQVCNNGCDSMATPNQCLSEDLRVWEIVDPCGPNNANWIFNPDGSEGEQTVNTGGPTLLLSPFAVEPPIRVQGDIKVNTTGDDDLIGFVFGYQGTGQFYLFDWKMTTQNHPVWGGLRYDGMQLTKVHYPNATDVCSQGVISQGTAPNASVLAPATDHRGGWLDLVTYRFFLEWRTNGDIDIVVTRADNETVVGTISVNEASLPDFTSGGRFGFYGLSQSNVVYSGFQIGTLVP